MEMVSSERIVCPKCQGKGWIYVDFDIFGRDREKCKCPRCEGSRVVDKITYVEYVPVG